MTDRNHHVQFRQWLPAHALQRLDEQGAVPMFSPTTMTTVGSLRQSPQQQHQNEESDKENAIPAMYPATTPTPRRPRSTRQHHADLRISPSTVASQETLFYSPMASSSHLSLGNAPEEFQVLEDDHQDESLASRTISVIHDPLEFSPFSGITHSTTLRPSSIMPLPPPSSSKHTPHRSRTGTPKASYTPPLSTVAATPYKTLPRLDMMSPTYFLSCTDVHTLQQIVHILTSSSSTMSNNDHRTQQQPVSLPSLLQLAQSRLQALQDILPESKMSPRTTTLASQQQQRHRPPPLQQEYVSFVAQTATATGGMHFNDDSLTLSTDTGDNESLRLLHEALLSSRNPLPPPPSQQQRQPHHNNKNRYYLSPSPTHHGSSGTPATTATNQHQKMLWRQQQQQQFVQQTQRQLQHTTKEVHELQQLLQTTTMRHDQSTTELQQALSSLQHKLEQQRREAEQSQLQQTKYKTRIDQLTHQLEQQQHLHLKEKSSLEQKQHQLQQFLQSSHRNVEVVTKERTHLLQKLVQTVLPDDDSNNNTPFIQVEKLTKEQREQVVSDFCAHLSDSQQRLQQLAHAMRETEHERRKIMNAYQQVKEKYRITNDAKVGLERDNQLLNAEIETLTQQLHDTHHYVETVTAQQSQWEQRQQESNAVIRRLKEQIRTSGTMVPIGMYKSALTSAEEQEVKANEYRQKVNALTAQVANLTTTLSKAALSHPPVVPAMEQTPTPPTHVLHPKSCGTPTAAQKGVRFGLTVSGTKRSSSIYRPGTPHHRASAAPRSVTPPAPSNHGQDGTPPPAGEKEPPPSSKNIPVKTPLPAKQATPHTQDGATTPKVTFTFTENHNPNPKSTTKIAKLRAAGGRKALEEQLRRIRSPRNLQL